MAETALGVVGLLGLFSSSVDCFQYVRIVKTFDRDYAAAQLNLDALGMRLARWGKALGIRNESTKTIPDSHYRHIESTLKNLIEHFGAAARKYPLLSNSGDMATYEASELAGEEQFVHQGMLLKKLEHAQPPHVGLVKRLKWALYKAKDLERLIDSIRSLIDNLETFVPASSLQPLIEAEIDDIQGELAVKRRPEIERIKVVDTLQRAVTRQDPLLEERVGTLMAQLQPGSDQIPGASRVDWTLNGNIQNNKGIVAGVNHGNQTNHHGGA